MDSVERFLCGERETYFSALTKKSGKMLMSRPKETIISMNVAESALPVAYTPPLYTSFFTSVLNKVPVCKK